MSREFFSAIVTPPHWKSIRLSSLIGSTGLFKDGDWIESPYIADHGIRLIQTGNVGVGSYREQGFRYISDDTFHALGCTEVKPGDVLICRLADPVGRACIVPDLGVKAITSVDNAILRVSEDHDSRYVVYLFSSKPYLDYLESECRGGTRNRVSRSFLGRLRIPVPDLQTQRAIANFLDRETAHIDQLIEKKEQHIELALERLAALLDRMTFRSSELSGWMRVPFKWVCRIPNGQVDPKEEPWSEMPLIAPNHIESRTGRVLNIESAAEQGAESGKYTYPAGTVLYSKIRPALAKACIAPENGLCSADMYPIIPAHSLLPGFLLMQLLSGTFTDWAVMESMRVAMPKVNRETLGPFPLIVAPIERQNELVGEWSAESNRTQDLVAKIRASIGKLSELRSALITAAVTGQIDVATWGKGDETDRRLEAIEHGLEAERERVGV